MTTITYWSITYLLQISSTVPDTKIFWFRIHELGVSATAVTWILFALAYTGNKEKITKYTIALFIAAAAPTTLIAAFDRLNLLFAIGTQTIGSNAYLNLELTPLAYATIGVNYILVLAGIYFFARMVLKREGMYRGQAVAILVGAIVPLVANLALVLGITGPVDFTPIGFAVSGVAFSIAIFRYRLLDIAPVARDRLIEGMKDGLVVLDPEGNVVDLNPSAEEVADENNAVGKNVREVLPKVADIVLDTDGGAVQEEIMFETGGVRRYFQVSVSNISAGNFVGKLVLLRDITGRMEVEKRFQELIENSSDIITLLDEDGVIRYQSPSIERILGYDQEEMLGEVAWDYVHPDDIEKVTEEFARGVNEPGYKTETEYRMKHKNGSWRVMESLGRNLLENPYVEGIVVNSRDVTERRRRERELRRTNKRLDEFASIVSHDLMNPLSVAKGYLEIAQEEHDSEELEQVEEAHDRMEKIIEDALTLARDGEGVVERTEVDIGEVAREAWNNVDTSDAELVVKTEMVVEADKNSVLRVFENLFGNSVEHGYHVERRIEGNLQDSGSANSGDLNPGSVTVEVGSLEDGRGFYVEDDGEGLSESEVDRVFEQGYSTTKGGTGLGLSIVKSIVEAHGWSINVSDGGMSGACFEVLVE